MCYENLDPATRMAMAHELSFDMQRGQLYISRRLTEYGRSWWPHMLLQAMWMGTDETLAAMTSQPGVLEAHELRQARGRSRPVRVPRNAALSLARGEFNRFYCRAVCLRAGAGAFVEVYRAKRDGELPRSSLGLVGRRVPAELLLSDLRINVGGSTMLGIPGGPSSGLSVRLV